MSSKKKITINYKLYKNECIILDKDFDINDKSIKSIILNKNPDKMKINDSLEFVIKEDFNIDLYLPQRKIIKRKLRKIKSFINNKGLFSV